MLLRIRTSAKMCRVPVTPSTTMGQVKEELRKDLNFEPQQSLLLGPKPHGEAVNDSDTVAGLNLRNGHMLYLDGSATAASGTGPTTASASVASGSSGGGGGGGGGGETSESEGPKPSGEAKSAMTTFADLQEKEDPSDANHKPFSQFLKEWRQQMSKTYKHGHSTVEWKPVADKEFIVRTDQTHAAKGWKMGMTSGLMPSAVPLQVQEYRHVDRVEIRNWAEMRTFISGWRKRAMTVQRAAFLYGYYESDPHKAGAVRAIVEAIFEPQQAGDSNSVRVLPDKKLKTANAIASVFGLHLIGWMFTHPPRKAEEPLLAPELRNMARLQNRFRGPSEPGSRFVTVTVGEEDGNVKPQAFMAADMLMALEKQGLLVDDEDPQWFQRRPEEKGEMLPQFRRRTASDSIGQLGNRFESQYMVVRLGITTHKHGSKAHKSPCFALTEFMWANREEMSEYQNPEILKAYLNAHAHLPDTTKMSDFHLLVYLADLFDLETAKMVAQAVKEGTDIPEGVKMMLQHLAQHSTAYELHMWRGYGVFRVQHRVIT